MPRLIFLGAPGAGKGTQAKALAEFCLIPHISTGDILRAAVANKTELGVQAKQYMDQGNLVPDQLIVDMIRERLHQADAQTGWILDGFPRNVAQAEFLEELLSEMAQPYDRVVNLDVPDEELVKRMLGRGRADDSEEVIRTRLKVYREQTQPLIDFYKQRQQLTHVNGNQPVITVTNELRQLLNSGIAPE